MTLCLAWSIAISAQPAAQEAHQDANNLIKNPSFEEWSGVQAPGWSCGQGHGAEWRGAPLKSSPNATQGKSACELPCPQGPDLVVLAQDIAAPGIQIDATLTVSADVKSKEPYSVQVKLSFKRKSGTVMQHRYNRGGDAWESIFWKFEVPPDADPASFRLEIIRFPERGADPVLLDNVTLKFEGV